MDVNTIAPSAEQVKGEALQHRLKHFARQAKGMNEAEIDKAAMEFESMFLSQMLNHMMKPINLPEPYGGGHAEEMFHSLLVDEYAKMMAESGGIGIASDVKRELLSLQEM